MWPQKQYTPQGAQPEQFRSLFHAVACKLVANAQKG